MRLLQANPNVQQVSETNISYTANFRLAAARANQEGQTPVEIFVQAGFDLDIIGHKKPKHCLKRWRDLCHSWRKRAAGGTQRVRQHWS